ncbi:Cadherin domain protein [Pseudovibrio axinellae]|uniref:Cadherin domain protein n=1 Tax=Pseudovibrio axinellae TaxID=989403 RepID=A0A165YAX8_9HYPH|nr:DUF5801 repeats-in-toxin domain-containing protein [Pseudovibrio axinellae]KZL18625.1 Cadherin domain protein [Pseudovibrio axinellae]SER74097.1 T1SS-143 domain-containing protein [Pseudovibrio axinellae]
MTNLSPPTHSTPAVVPLPPILLAVPPAPSKTPIVIARQQGQLVDLSKIVGTAKLSRHQDELHISQGDGQTIVIEDFFGGPANEFFILMPSGPLTTQQQFLSLVEIETGTLLGSFQSEAPSPAKDNAHEDASPTQSSGGDETPVPPPSPSSLLSALNAPLLERLNIKPTQSTPNKVDEDDYLKPVVANTLSSQTPSIVFPDISPSELYTQPDSSVTRAGDTPVLSVQETSLQTGLSVKVSGSLELDFGADGQGTQALMFALDAAGRPLIGQGTPLNITSGGDTLVFQSQFGAEGQHILRGLKGDGTLVFEIVLDPTAASGAYSYEQFAQLDHLNGSYDLLLSFQFIATDSDGDTLVSNLDIRVEDDPISGQWNLTATVSEADLTGGSNGNSGAVTLTQDLPINEAQGPVTLEWTQPAPAAGFSYIQEGQTLLILQGNAVVLSVSLNSSAGSYTVTQHNAIENALDADAVFNLSFTATNAQGQSVDGQLVVTSLDDAPKAFALNQINFEESQLEAGANLRYSSDELPHSAGADEAQITWQMPENAEGLTYIINGQLLNVMQGETLILTAQFTNASGAYTVQQHNPLTHSSGLDEQNIKLFYKITDGDGDTATGNLSVSIKDDAPTVGDQIDIALSDNVLSSSQETADFKSPGAINGVLPVSSGVDNGHVNWALSDLPDGFQWDLSDASLTVYQDSRAIFTATLNSVTGEYTIEQHAPLSHAQGVEQFQLLYTAQDADGDTAQGQLQITISDSVPVQSSAPETISLSETDLFAAQMGGDASISKTGQLNIVWGADTSASNGAAASLSFSSAMNAATAPFTVNGAQVLYSINADGNTLTARTQDGTLVFNITLDPNATGQYLIEFFTPIDHSTSADVNLTFTATATDGDGDAIPITFDLGISNSHSNAVADNFTGVEDTPLVLDLIANDTLSSQDFTIHIVLAPAKGHLSQNADNTFNYIGNPDTYGSDSFSYYIEDQNGERSEITTVSIELTPENDAPVFSGASQSTPLHLTTNATREGEIFKANASDAEGEPLRFFLQGSDQAHFNINEQTGEVTWKDSVSYDTPLDEDGDNTYEIAILVKDEQGATATQEFHIEVTQGSEPVPDPMQLNLFTRQPGTYQVQWDFDEASYLSSGDDPIQSDNWIESGDDGDVLAAGDGSSDIYIDEENGHLILSDRSVSSPDGDNNDASISKTFDLTGAENAAIELTYTASFSDPHPDKMFYIEVTLADGSVHRIAEISSLNDSEESQTLSLDLRDFISSATTIRVVAPGDLTSADILKIEDVVVSVDHSEALEQQHYEANYQLGSEGLAIAKSAQIDDTQEQITGMTLTLYNAQSGDELLYTPADGLTSTLEDAGNGMLILTISGAADAAVYQDLLNTVQFASSSESLETRNLSVRLHAGDESSAPSITTIHVAPGSGTLPPDLRNMIEGTSQDDVLRSSDNDDTINGYDGDDELVGGRGANELTGGAGSDTYVFEFIDGLADHITDLELNTSSSGSSDAIDLSKLFADYSDDSFIEIYGRAEQYIQVVTNEDGRFELRVDLDGNGDDNGWESVATFTPSEGVGSSSSVSVLVSDIMPSVDVPLGAGFAGI